MRLLNTHDLELTEFTGDFIPDYAILSHTWVADEEISLQDLEAIQNRPKSLSPHSYAQRSGYKKIEQCCSLARQEQYDWVWIDTCCIDKTSSAELSEAINSMFQWYQKSRICYTLLSDVSDGDSVYEKNSEFRRCRWLTRGWTLQELLAPQELILFSKEWTVLGTRLQLGDLLSEVTNIPPQYLGNNPDYPLREASVAQRMSWAAARSTTRLEDLAYCLLGIFDVNMPLLYGEGMKAFRRLQHEIISQTEDQSIFTWGYGMPTTQWTGSNTSTMPSNGDVPHEASPSRPNHHPAHPYLAPSPAEFAGCSNVVVDDIRNEKYVKDFAITKRGLRISIALIPEFSSSNRFSPHGRRPSAEVLGILNCRPSRDLFNLIVIPLTWPEDRDGEPAVTLRGPPRLWPRRLMGWPVFKTLYIVASSAADVIRPSEKLIGPRDSIIVPRTTDYSVELLHTDGSISVRAPKGADHFIVSEDDNRGRAPAPGRAYFQLRQTPTSSAAETESLLVLMVFHLFAPGFQLSSDLSNGDSGLPDFSSIPLSYPRNRPKKLRRRRIHFEEDMKRVFDRKWKEEKRKKVAAWGKGWATSNRFKHWILRESFGSVHCFIARPPEPSQARLNDPEFLRALHWKRQVVENLVAFTPVIVNERVMGERRAVFHVEAGTRGLNWRLPDLFRQTFVFRAVLQNEFNFPRFISFSVLAFVSAIAAAATVSRSNVLAGATWTVLSIAFVALNMSQSRKEHDTPAWMIRLLLFLGFVFAAFASIDVIWGLVALGILSITAVVVALLYESLFGAVFFFDRGGREDTGWFRGVRGQLDKYLYWLGM